MLRESRRESYEFKCCWCHPILGIFCNQALLDHRPPLQLKRIGNSFSKIQLQCYSVADLKWAGPELETDSPNFLVRLDARLS